MPLSLMAILSISGIALWKLVKYNGKKYSQVSEIKNLYEKIKTETQISKNEGNVSKNFICFDWGVTK